MHTNEPREDPLVEMGYEIRDIDFSKLRWAVAIFFIFTALCAAVGWVMYLNRFWVFALPAPSNTANLRVPMPGAQYPLLQDNVTSKIDIATLRQQETARMTSTGTNPDGSVHIPVERAMTLVAQRGVPPTHHVVPAVSRANILGPNLLGTPPPQPYGTPNPPSGSPRGDVPVTEPGEGRQPAVPEDSGTGTTGWNGARSQPTPPDTMPPAGPAPTGKAPASPMSGAGPDRSIRFGAGKGGPTQSAPVPGGQTP